MFESYLFLLIVKNLLSIKICVAVLFLQVRYKTNKRQKCILSIFLQFKLRLVLDLEGYLIQITRVFISLEPKQLLERVVVDLSPHCERLVVTLLCRVY